MDARGLAISHAEVVTVSLVQAAADSRKLADTAANPVLVVDAQPCVMCLGALIWSGIRRFEFPALGSGVERLTGFDEEPVPDDWRDQLDRRGITVETERDDSRALEVLRHFRVLVEAGNLPLYNGAATRRQPVLMTQMNQRRNSVASEIHRLVDVPCSARPDSRDVSCLERYLVAFGLKRGAEAVSESE